MTLDWYRQNPAVEGFTAALAGRASPDSLFVVGRNLYQAACGGSNSASAYLDDFVSHTQGLKPERRKALLDGMLFEVFYDPNAQLRKDFKLQKFEALFRVQQHPKLAPSFEFIAECLLPDIARFYSIPGKKHPVVVDVVSKAGAAAGNHILKSLHCGGDSILWLEDADYAPEAGEAPLLEKLRLSKFEERVAEQMVVPAHLLKINYLSFRQTGDEKIHFPYGWTARKR